MYLNTIDKKLNKLQDKTWFYRQFFQNKFIACIAKKPLISYSAR